MLINKLFDVNYIVFSERKAHTMPPVSAPLLTVTLLTFLIMETVALDTTGTKKDVGVKFLSRPSLYSGLRIAPI